MIFRNSLIIIGMLLGGFISAQCILSTSTDIYVSAGEVVSINEAIQFLESENGQNVGLLKTNKDAVNPGVIFFTENAGWTAASSNQFVDGYVESNGHTSFVAPIGSGSVYAPIRIQNGSSAQMAFYQEFFGDFPTGDNVKAVLANKYWNVRSSDDAVISIAYDAQDNISELTGNLPSALTILGFKDGVWEVIPSTLDEFKFNTAHNVGSDTDTESNETTGSISTENAVDLSEYQWFAIGVLDDGSLDGETESAELAMFLSPNPIVADQALKVDYTLPSGSGMLRLITPSNKVIYEKELDSVTDEISLLNLPFDVSGILFVMIEDDNGKVITKKLLNIE